MSDQKNPPRTREVQIDVVYPDESSELIMTKDYYVHALLEAEARGRSEALDELRAGAEPVKYEVRDLRSVKSGWLTCSQYAYEAYQGESNVETRVLYKHPPVPREAELAAENANLRRVLAECADAFVKMGGIEPAEKIRAALAAAPETRG